MDKHLYDGPIPRRPAQAFSKEVESKRKQEYRARDGRHLAKGVVVTRLGDPVIGVEAEEKTEQSCSNSVVSSTFYVCSRSIW